MTTENSKVELHNFTSPSHVYRVDRTKYEAMRKANLPQDLFPGGAKAGWWLKAT